MQLPLETLFFLYEVHFSDYSDIYSTNVVYSCMQGYSELHAIFSSSDIMLLKLCTAGCTVRFQSAESGKSARHVQVCPFFPAATLTGSRCCMTVV